MTEGGLAAFDVTLGSGATGPVTVSYATTDGTAAAGTDYTSADGTLTFEVGERAKRVEVQTLEDDEQEERETFTVGLSAASGATLTDPTGVGRIVDDDGGGPGEPLPQLRIADAEVTEGGLAAFDVTLGSGATGPVTVSYATTDGTAAAGTDYTSADGTLTFEVGERAKRVEVQTLEDDEQEETETFTVRLSAASGATLTDPTGVGRIVDDDGGGPGEALPQLRIADAEVTEGGLAAFDVTLGSGATGPVTVSYATTDGTAAAGTDYTSADGTLTFEVGERAKRVEVQTLEDDEQEERETFTVGLSAASGATLTDPTGVGRIVDDDGGGPGEALPQLRIGDAEVTEGGLAAFDVTLGSGATGPVTVSYATTDGTAAAGTDYTSADGALTFEVGERTKRVDVQTLEDDEQEETETFTVRLSAASGATLTDPTGVGRIVDDDGGGRGRALPEVRIGDAEVTEGGLAAFDVTLSSEATRPVTVSYATTDGTAVAGTDYTSADGALTFEVGERTKRVDVQTLEDDEQEERERFTVRLSKPSGARVARRVGVGTILDNDDGGPGEPLPQLRIADAEVTEGGLAAFDVTLSSEATGPVTVSYATTDGTAVAGTDYTSADGALTFEVGERTKRVDVQTLEDDEQEETETFTVRLSAASGATLTDPTGVGRIVDDDEAPSLTIGDAPTVREGSTAEFVVRLSSASGLAVSVSYRTVDGTAAAGADYTAAAGTLRFEPGETVHTLAVETLTDQLLESVERFTVELSGVEGATVADGAGVGTITDDARRSIGAVHRIVLPEMGRAMGFTANCRIEQAFLRPAARGPRDLGTAGLSLSPALTSGRWGAAGTEPLTVERALDDLMFLVSSQEGEGSGGRLAAWGCGNHRNLSGGDNGAVPWSGDVFSGHLGADMRLGSNLLTGLSVSRSRGSFDFRIGGFGGPDGGGAYELRLTGVHPYLAWSVSPDVNVWGTFGHGWGELQFTNDLAGGVHTSPSTLNSGMVGVNGRLLARGGASVRVKGEWAIARMDVAAAASAAFDAVAVNLQRFRLTTEVSQEYVFSSGQSFGPWGELGLRHDAGDGETGAGLEMGGGLRYRHPGAGFTAEGQARWLAMHEGTIDEWGFSALLLFDPGVSDRGPSVGLAPAWGSTLSGVQHLWERGSTDPSLYDAVGTRVDAHFGYGFGVPRSGAALTPYVSVRLGDEAPRGYRVGSLLSAGRSANVSLELERRNHPLAPDTYGLAAHGTIRF